MTKKKENDSENLRTHVREGYAKIADNKSSCCSKSNSDKVALELGYSSKALAALPDGANMGLSCGNPTAIASLKKGETVLDLGSGGGFDVFIAAEKVGKTGKAIGVDMTHEMISKARKNLNEFQKRTKLSNVEFRLGEIEHLPVADNSVDVVISNCVINLSPDKEQVWKEIFRVLKPGGRAAISDLALLKPLPSKVVESISALVGCVAGAILKSETESFIKNAGFADYDFEEKSDYVDRMTKWNDPLYLEIIRQLPKKEKLSSYITSLYVSTVKSEKAALSENIQELVAIGASVTAHCQPCFTYHLKKAISIGVSDAEIKSAMATGEAVQRGATGAMAKYIAAELSGRGSSQACPSGRGRGETGCSCSKSFNK